MPRPKYEWGPRPKPEWKRPETAHGISGASLCHAGQIVMADHLPRIEYDQGQIVRRVGTTKAYVSFKGHLWKVPQVFCGEQIAIRPRGADGQYAVCFGAYQIPTIDLTYPQCVGDVPEQVSAKSPG